MNREAEEAIQNITIANRRILIAMGLLLLASLNATHAMRNLQVVLENENIPTSADTPPTIEGTAYEVVEELNQ